PCAGEEAPASLRESDAEPEGLPRGAETILLVEDEEIVRKMTRNILEECGYEVLTASNGVEALKVCASHGGAIDLLLTDVVMPHMGGRRLAEHMKVSHPRTRVLYMSGYTDDAILRHGVLEATAALMETHCARLRHKPERLLHRDARRRADGRALELRDSVADGALATVRGPGRTPPAQHGLRPSTRQPLRRATRRALMPARVRARRPLLLTTDRNPRSIINT